MDEKRKADGRKWKTKEEDFYYLVGGRRIFRCGKCCSFLFDKEKKR